MALIPHSVSVRFNALMGGFTGPLAAAGGAVNRFGRGVGGALNTVNRLGTQMEAAGRRIQTLQRGLADAPRTMSPAVRQAMQGEIRRLQDQQRVLQRQRQAFHNLGQTATMAGVAMVAGFGLAVKAAADFDKSMSKVAAVSGAAGKELGALRKAAIDAGRDTQFSAVQAADATAELAKAGISTADILGGALKGSLALAAAGELEFADAATVSAQAMNIFSLKGTDVTHVADVLAAGANKSAADVKGLAWSLRMGGQVAAQTGLSLESTVGTLSAFADNALIGSDAGTSLKVMLQHLANPSEKAMGLMRDLGLEVYDANGNFVGMDKLARNLQVSLGGLTQEQRDQAMATIFGSDAVRGANVLYKIGAAGVKEYTDAVNDNGAAARTAAKLTDNLAGDIERLKGSLETALIQSGSGANNVLREMVQAIGAAINAYSALPASVQSGTMVIIGLTGAVILLTKGLMFMIGTVKDAKVALLALGITGARVTAAMTAIRSAFMATAAFMAGPWGLAIGAAVIALSVFMINKRKATQATEEFTSAIKADSGAMGENTRQAIANDLEKRGLLKTAQKLGLDMGTLTEAVIGNKNAMASVTEVTDAYRVKLKTMLDQGKLTWEEWSRADTTLNQFEKSIKDQNGSLAMSVESYKRVTAATAGASTETKNLTAAQVAAAAKAGVQTSAEQKLIDVMRDASRTSKDLKDAFDELAGGNIAAAKAAIQQRQALKDASEASDHRRGLTDKETLALISLAENNQDVIVSMKDANATGDQMIAKQRQLTQAFIKSAIGMGASRAEATEMARSFGLFMKVADNTTASLNEWIFKAGSAANAAKTLALRTGGDAKGAQDSFRASVQKSLPVLYAMAGSNQRLRGQVDALARSAGIATGKMDTSRRSFLAAASSMGIGAREAGKLWAKLQTLKSRSIKVSVDAKGQWKAFNNGVAVPGSERPGFAQGGPVPMVSGGSRAYDSVPAVLRVDEHVLTPEEVAAMGGHAAVYRLRKAALRGDVQGFANGGRVGGAELTTSGSASRVFSPIASGYTSMINTVVKTLANEIKKAMSGGGIVSAARRWIGTPYSWGGGGKGGPSYGIGRGAGTYGFDCSGLTEYAWWKGRRVSIGGWTGPQEASSHRIAGPRPGALGFVGNPTHHVMLASDRPGYVIQAPYTGSFVQEVQRSSSNWRWPNAAGKARGGPVTKAEMIAGRRFIMGQDKSNDAAMYGLAGDPGMVPGYSNGGWVIGPSGRDRVLMRGTLGEFVVKSGPAKKNKALLEALNVGRLVVAKPKPPPGSLTEMNLWGHVSDGPYTGDKLDKGKSSDFNKPSKPRKTPDLKKKKPKSSITEAISAMEKGKGSGSSGSGSSDVDFSGFIAALAGASRSSKDLGIALGMSRTWTQAFTTSIANATRRIDTFSGSGGGGTVYQITLENHGVIGSKTEVDKWLAASLERLRRNGKL
jgi:TP901 family phage tail tape measure protein